MKVHKLVVMVIDFDGLGDDEVMVVLEAQKFPNWCIAPKVMGIDTKEVDWEDNHPLNRCGTQYMAFKELFDGNE